MKIIQEIIMVGALGLALTANLFAQTSPYLSLTQNSPSSVQINWTNQVGTTYRILFTPDLTTPLSLWSPLEDAFSDDDTISAGVSSARTPNGFFSVEIPTNSGIEIFSPTNNQTVSGEIAVGVGVQIGSQIQGVSLYLDDSQISYIDSGGIAFNLDTTHFTNGLHTLYVDAVNTANNATTSDPITLDFENPVRWPDAGSLFQDFVPIDVQSDIYPADWEIVVEDANGVTVRTISGSTSDGNINTNWDGTDNNGNTVPAQAAYKVTIAVASDGFGNSLAMESANSDLSSVSASQNAYGVTEYTVEKPALDLTETYSAYWQSYSNAPENEKILFPPLQTNAPAVITKKVSPLEMFLAQHSSRTASSSGSRGVVMNADSGSGSTGLTSATLWREASWNSGEIVICRQKLTGLNGVIFDGAAANLCDNVKTSVALAQDEIDNGSRRGVHGNSVMTMQHNGDFGAVKTALASNNPNVREFYFWGHGARDGNSIGFKEGTPTDGITVNDLHTLLGNTNFTTPSGQKLYATTKPFDFVFLDGCMLGLGSFPEAFGIPKSVPGSKYNDNHLHKRAYMGWAGTISYSILDTETMNWALSFWESWLGDPTSKTVIQAQTDAFSAHPSGGDGVPMKTYGNVSLTWGYFNTQTP